jgi:hypothetical protein
MTTQTAAIAILTLADLAKLWNETHQLAQDAEFAAECKTIVTLVTDAIHALRSGNVAAHLAYLRSTTDLSDSELISGVRNDVVAILRDRD